MKYGIYVGATPEAVKAAVAGILAILDHTIDAPVAVEALKTLATLCSVHNTTIQYCTINGAGTKTRPKVKRR